jgi:hypothetical protein
MVIFLLGFLLLIFLSLISRLNKRLERAESYLRNSLMWNSTLRFVMQQFPPLMIAGVINMYYIKWDNIPNTICSILSFVITAVMILALFMIGWVTWRNEEKV